MGLVLLDALQTRELVEANLDYYGPRTDHGSSLSLAMHSVAASIAHANRTRPMTTSGGAAAIDLEDSMSARIHGIHAAAQGGLLQAALFGFGGLHLDRGRSRDRRPTPGSWGFPRLHLRHRGTLHEGGPWRKAGPQAEPPGAIDNRGGYYETQDLRGPGTPDRLSSLPVATVTARIRQPPLGRGHGR